MGHDPHIPGRPLLAATLALALAAPWPAARADEFASEPAPPADCLAEAALVIRPGEALTVQLRDGQRFDGRLVAFDAGKRLVIIDQWDELGAAHREFAADRVARYEYQARDANGAKAGGAVLGSAVGAVVGLGLAEDGNAFMSAAQGAVVGGAVGYVVGGSAAGEERPAGAIVCGER